MNNLKIITINVNRKVNKRSIVKNQVKPVDKKKNKKNKKNIIGKIDLKYLMYLMKKGKKEMKNLKNTLMIIKR